MGSENLVDVIRKLLSVKVPDDRPVFLCFAKTDREKSSFADDSSDEETKKSLQSLNHRKWVRQYYKKPFAAAGLRANILATANPAVLKHFKKKRNRVSRERVEAEKAREYRLRAEACRGVVQLFNAIRDQQKNLQKELQEKGTTEVKREKVLASLSTTDFLDRLALGTKKKKKTVL